MDCEPFAGSAVAAGWICCQCRHFNGGNTYQCWKCEHLLCLVAPTPKGPPAMTAKAVMKDCYGHIKFGSKAKDKSYADWLDYLGIIHPLSLKGMSRLYTPQVDHPPGGKPMRFKFKDTK